MNNSKYECLLTHQECETILKRYFKSNNFKLVNYKLRPLSDDVKGFLGEHLWLNIEVIYEDIIKEIRFFAKLRPEIQFLSEFCKQLSAFPNEICFYENIVPTYKTYYEKFDETIIPKYYFSKDNLVILEDCTQMKFQVADTPDVLSIAHIKVVLKTLAKLHAASIITEERKSAKLNKKYRLIDDYEKYLKETFFYKNEDYIGYKWHKVSLATNLDIIDRMSEEQVNRDEFKKQYSELAEKCCEIAQPSKQFRNVCCHADLWRNNIMFKYENNLPVECKFLDFQLIKYYPPAYDILKFVHQVMSSEARQHYLDDLMTYYYKHLFSELELDCVDATIVLPFDQFQASIQYILGYSKIEASYCYHFQRVGGEYLKEVSSDIKSYENYILKTRTAIIDKFYIEGSYFKKWMDEILLEINDIINDNVSR